MQCPLHPITLTQRARLQLASDFADLRDGNIDYELESTRRMEPGPLSNARGSAARELSRFPPTLALAGQVWEKLLPLAAYL